MQQNELTSSFSCSHMHSRSSLIHFKKHNGTPAFFNRSKHFDVISVILDFGYVNLHRHDFSTQTDAVYLEMPVFLYVHGSA